MTTREYIMLAAMVLCALAALWAIVDRKESKKQGDRGVALGWMYATDPDGYLDAFMQQEIKAIIESQVPAPRWPSPRYQPKGHIPSTPKPPHGDSAVTFIEARRPDPTPAPPPKTVCRHCGRTP